MEKVNCSELLEGKAVKMGDILIVGTKKKEDTTQRKGA